MWKTGERKSGIKSFCLSYKGKRTKNEDFVKAETIKIRDREIYVAAIADGMGGHRAGEIASKTAVEGLFDFVKNNPDIFPLPLKLQKALSEAYCKINHELIKLGKNGDELTDLGTTLTAIILKDDSFWISHIGDTRVYLIKEESIEQLTKDHSAVAESIRDGILNEQDARASPFAHALTRYLGSAENFTPDIQPLRGSYKIDDGSVIILCSDGITSVLSELDIYEAVIFSENIREAAHKIISLAYNSGSNDNMSLILIEYGNLIRKKNSLKYVSKRYIKLPARSWSLQKSIYLATIILIILSAIFLIIYRNSSNDRKFLIRKIPIKNQSSEIAREDICDQKPISIKIVEEDTKILFQAVTNGSENLDFFLLVYDDESGQNLKMEIPLDKEYFFKEHIIKSVLERYPQGGEFFYKIEGRSKNIKIESELRLIEISDKK